jgi:hypothetical protein
MEEERYSSNNLNLGTRWSWLLRFKALPLYALGNSPKYPWKMSLAGPFKCPLNPGHGIQIPKCFSSTQFHIYVTLDIQGGPDSIRQFLVINNQSIQQHTGKWKSTFCCRWQLPLSTTKGTFPFSPVLLDWLVINDQKLPNWVWPTLYVEIIFYGFCPL